MGITSVSEMVAAAKQNVENLNVDQVASEIEAGAVVVDLRESEELAQTGKIPGAIHVPRGMLEFRADPSSNYHYDELDPSKRIIVHCAAGGRSALAARTLAEMGYGNVAHLDGGMTAWIEAGRPTEPVA
jgi:rhodanese-related sulfurtransferase